MAESRFLVAALLGMTIPELPSLVYPSRSGRTSRRTPLQLLATIWSYGCVWAASLYVWAAQNRSAWETIKRTVSRVVTNPFVVYEGGKSRPLICFRSQRMHRSFARPLSTGLGLAQDDKG